MKPKYIIGIVIVILVAVGGYWAVKTLFPEEEVTGPVYSTSEVIRGDIEVGVDVTGSLNPSWGGSISVPGGYNSSSTISSYIIAEVYATVGDEVSAGQPIALLAAPSISTQAEDLRKQIEVDRKSLASLLDIDISQVDSIDPNRGISITAPIDGRLMDCTVKSGETLEQGAVVGRVVDSAKFVLTAKLTSVEIAKLKSDWKALIKFESLYSYSYAIPGEITDINLNAVPELSKDLIADQSIAYDKDSMASEFVYWVDVEAKNPGLVQPGMLASIGFYDPAKFATPEDAMASPSDVMWIRYYAKVDGYADEEEILNRIKGVVTKVNVKNMADVKTGDVILTMSGQDVTETIVEKMEDLREKRSKLAELEAQEGSLTLLSPSDGVISEFDKKAGQSVNAGDWLGSVFSVSDMRMYCMVDDIDVVLIQIGALCDVTLDAFPDQVFQGEVEYINSYRSSDQGSSFEVSIKVAGNSSIRSGMQAKAKIGAAKAEAVVLAPLEAIFRDDGQNKVELMKEDGTIEMVPVEVGLMNNRYAEIISGLNEGDLVVTGSSQDLLPSTTTTTGGGLLGN